MGWMARGTLLAGAVSFLILAPFWPDALAQHSGGPMMCPMMEQGMMGRGPGVGKTGDPVGMGPGMDLMGTLHRWGTSFFSMREELGITRPQLDRIQTILISHTAFAVPKHAQRQVLVMEVLENLTGDSPDWSAIEQKIRSIGNLDTEMNAEGVRTLEKALAALNPEQRTRMRSLFRDSIFSRILGTGGRSIDGQTGKPAPADGQDHKGHHGG